MIECSKIEYSGTFLIGERKYTFSRAAVSDAKQISVIYEQTRIDRINYKTKLSEDSPLRFEKKGGMFIVMNEEEITEQIASPDSFWAVIKDENGNIVGSLWSCMTNEFYKGSRYEHAENCIYPREIAVSSESGGKSIAQAMYVTCAEAFLKAGYQIGIGDLYRVLKYESAEGVFHTDQINIPSRMAMEAIGARFLGTLPQREIHLDGLTVTIEPQVFVFDYGKIAALSSSFFVECGELRAVRRE